MLKISIIGLGNMGTNHLRILKEISNVDVVGVSDINIKITNEIARKFNVAVYSDYKKMLSEKNPDVVIVVVPTNKHHEIVLYALNHGMHVLVEKPIANSIKEAQEMIDEAKKRKLIFGVGHIERFNPAIIKLKENIKLIGNIFMIHSRRQSPNPKRINDVGVIKDLAIHELDMMLYLTKSEVENLNAEILNVIQKDREDIIFGLIRFKNNILGILDVNWVTPTIVREISITGEKGMFVVNYLTQDLFFYENPALINPLSLSNWESERNFNVEAGNMTKFQINKKEPLRNELEFFIECVRKKKEFLIKGIDGYNALALAEKIIEIGKSKKCEV